MLEVKPTKATVSQIVNYVLALAFGLLLLATLINKIALWTQHNKIMFQFPVVVRKMVWVEKIGEPQILSPLAEMQNETAEVNSYPEGVDTDIEKYICDKWGIADCKMALAIAKAESGIRCDAIGINKNGTADIGVFQLNTVHMNKGGDWTLANMADCYKNVDLAYELYEQQGYKPWVVYNNGWVLAKY